MTQMEYFQDVTKELLGHRKFGPQVDSLLTVVKYGERTMTDCIMQDFFMIMKYAVESWMDFGEISSQNMMQTMMIDKLGKELSNENDYKFKSAASYREG